MGSFPPLKGEMTLMTVGDMKNDVPKNRAAPVSGQPILELAALCATILLAKLKTPYGREKLWQPEQLTPLLLCVSCTV